MASTFVFKRKTFGKKFDAYIKKNKIKVEDAKIVEEGAKKLKLGRPSKIAAGVALGLAAAGTIAAKSKKDKNKSKKED